MSNRYTSVPYVEFHSPIFMQGTNLGNKLNVKHRPMVLIHDREDKIIYVYFKDKMAAMPDSNVVSWDYAQVADCPIPADVLKSFGIGAKAEEVKRGPGRPPKAEADKYTVNPAALETAQTHLIKQARDAVAGLKHPAPSAQVSNPTQPAEGLTGLQGKAKYMSHAELAKVVAKEKAEAKS